MSRLDNLGDKAGSNGFDKNPQNARKGGRKVSVRKQLEELLEKEGRVKIEAKQVISIEEDGSVIIKLPTEMQLAMKLSQLAMGNKSNNIKAIQMIIEQIDGKPRQPLDIDGGVITVYKKPMEIEDRSGKK